jgi:hypothetical protein
MTLKWAVGGYMVRSWDRTYSSDTSDDAATIVASVGGGQDSQPSESYHILGDSGTPNLLLPQNRVQYRWSPDMPQVIYAYITGTRFTSKLASEIAESRNFN